MMRPIMFIALVGLAAPAWAAFDTTDWTWQRPIEPGLDAAGFVRVPIDLEVMDASQPSLNDLRVLDANGKLVPHVVYWGRATEEYRHQWRDVRLINRTFQPHEYERVTLDFGRPVEKNRIEVDVSGENYRRRIAIEGSINAESWESILEDGWVIYASTPENEVKDNTVDFSRNNFRYLRLTVYHMPDDPERITIHGVKAARYEKVGDKELVEVPVATMTSTYDDEKKQSVYELDLGSRNVPVGEIRIATSEQFYHRGYELYGRNAPTEKIERKTETGWDVTEREVPWRRVCQGALYRTRDEDGRLSESNSAEGLRASYRHLQMRVFEGDNPPLPIDGISVFRREVSIVFDYTPGPVYTLTGGNRRAQAPRYDLARALDRVEEFELPVAYPGPATLLDSEPELAPWSERHGTVLLCLIAGGTLVMLYVVLKNIRQFKEE